MAVEKYYHDLDLVGVSQIKNARKHNVTQAEMDSLSLALGAEHKGLFIYNTETEESSTWNGSEFKIDAPKVQGAMVYQSAITSPTAMPSGELLQGYTYVYTGPDATLSWADQTFYPDASIETNDQIIYRGNGIWDIYDGSEELANETVAGIVKRATAANTMQGTEADTFVSPATLTAYRNNRKLTTVYFADGVSLTANVPFTVQHNLNLQNKDAFTVRIADTDGYNISASVQSKDLNSIEITSSVSLTAVKITLIGF